MRLDIANSQLEEYQEMHGRRISYMWILFVVYVVMSGAMGFSRVLSNYRNYSGIMHTWDDVHKEIFSRMNPSGKQMTNTPEDSAMHRIITTTRSFNFEAHQIYLHQRAASPSSRTTIPSTLEMMDSANSSELTVCMGGDWYTFASHFFLPQKTFTLVTNHTTVMKGLESSTFVHSEGHTTSVNLQYVSDNFHGLLPAHFQSNDESAVCSSEFGWLDSLRNTRWSKSGTFSHPTAAFNDRNSEELDRYVDIAQCDYIVTTMHQEYSDEMNHLSTHNRDINEFKRRVASSERIKNAAPLEKYLLYDRYGLLGDWESSDLKPAQFQNLIRHPLIDPPGSPSWTRAFFIPKMSERLNKFNSYSVFKRIESL